MNKLVKVVLLILVVWVAFSFGKRVSPPRLIETSSRVWEEEGESLAPLLSMPAPAPGRKGASEFAEDVSDVSEAPEEGGSLSERLVIKTGRLSLLVADVRKSAEEISRLAEDKGGFVLSADIRKTKPESEKLVGLVRIKVPSEEFNQVFSRIKELGLKVTSENVSGQDVTEEYTDLQSRLRNLEAAEAQLLELMKRAGEVTEILEVQKELVRTRDQIERTKGRIEFLEKSAAMATITINLATEEEELPIVEEGWRPRKVARASLRSLVSFWQRISNLIIWLVIFLSPFIIVGFLVWIWRKVRG